MQLFPPWPAVLVAVICKSYHHLGKTETSADILSRNWIDSETSPKRMPCCATSGNMLHLGKCSKEKNPDSGAHSKSSGTERSSVWRSSHWGIIRAISQFCLSEGGVLSQPFDHCHWLDIVWVKYTVKKMEGSLLEFPSSSAGWFARRVLETEGSLLLLLECQSLSQGSNNSSM